MNKRLDYVDIAKGLGILLVVLGHIKLEYFPYCGSVHIPLFFVAAGFLCDLSNEETRTYGKVVMKRSLRLLVPYGIYSLLLYIKYLLKLIVSSQNFLVEASKAFLGVLYSSSILYKNVSPEKNFNGFVFGNGPLWFLTAMVISSLVFYAIVFFILKHQFDIKKILFSMVVLTAFSRVLCWCLPIYLPWSFEMAILGTVFMLFGLLLRNLGMVEGWRKDCVKYLWVPFLAIIMFTVLHRFNGLANMAAQDYGRFMSVYLLLGMLGSVIVIYLACMLEKVRLVNSLFVYLGQNTLVILALHMTIISMLVSVLGKMNLHMLVEGNWFFVPSALIGVVVPLVIKEILVRGVKVPKQYL